LAEVFLILNENHDEYASCSGVGRVLYTCRSEACSTATGGVGGFVGCRQTVKWLDKQEEEECKEDRYAVCVRMLAVMCRNREDREER
jgi:hypothetical protein